MQKIAIYGKGGIGKSTLTDAVAPAGGGAGYACKESPPDWL